MTIQNDFEFVAGENKRSGTSPNRSEASLKRSGISPSRPDVSPLSSPSFAAIDGGNDSKKNVWCIFQNTPGECKGYVRIERRTPKKGRLSKKKNGEQKYVYVLENPEDYTTVTDRTILGLLSDPRLSHIKVFRVEPDIGSYHKDKDQLIKAFRDEGRVLLFCDSKLTARMRIIAGIIKDETTDITDASLILHASSSSFGKARLSSETVNMDRQSVKEQLERSEEANWADSFSLEALSAIDPKDIGERFGTDLATPVFIVTAFAAAMDPQVNSRRDLDRFCGLFARARNGKTGVGSVISSNLSHFNDNPQNRKASRYIYHKVCSTRRPGFSPNRSGLPPLVDLGESKRPAFSPDRPAASPLLPSPNLVLAVIE